MSSSSDELAEGILGLFAGLCVIAVLALAAIALALFASTVGALIGAVGYLHAARAHVEPERIT